MDGASFVEVTQQLDCGQDLRRVDAGFELDGGEDLRGEVPERPVPGCDPHQQTVVAWDPLIDAPLGLCEPVGPEPSEAAADIGIVEVLVTDDDDHLVQQPQTVDVASGDGLLDLGDLLAALFSALLSARSNRCTISSVIAVCASTTLATSTG